MIRHVYERATASGAVEVIIATDDERIAAAARSFGAPVAMTRAEHESGTDRVAEVARLHGWQPDAIVVNVQGDSPLVPPRSIGQVAGLMAANPGAAIGTLCTRLAAVDDYRNPNVVKVVMDQAGRALYFSRAPIPFAAHGGTSLPNAWRHLGIYAYRVGDLERLSRAQPCYLETVEKLEQLRALWLGMDIRVEVAAETHGPDIDTPAGRGGGRALSFRVGWNERQVSARGAGTQQRRNTHSSGVHGQYLPLTHGSRRGSRAPLVHDLESVVQLDSAGTHGYHAGSPPDERAQAAALRRGVDISTLRARRVAQSDFEVFDLILAMDDENVEALRGMASEEYHHKIQLFMEYAAGEEGRVVPDPYYGGPIGFERVLDMVDEAAEGLMARIKEEISGR